MKSKMDTEIDKEGPIGGSIVGLTAKDETFGAQLVPPQGLLLFNITFRGI